MSSDPLSDVLSLLRPQNLACRGFDFGGSWAFRWDLPDGINCYAVVAGRCWLTMEALESPLELRTGDCFLLPRGLSFGMGTDQSILPIDALQSICSSMVQGTGTTTFQNGGECFIIGAHFSLESGLAELLTNLLTPLVLVRSESDKTELRWALDRMRSELQGDQPGRNLIAQQLACMILVQALRQHLSDRTTCNIGWLFAMADHSLKAAINSMHEDPSHPWTLEQLARKSGLSRSSFVKRFREAVGETPMAYLTRWRMLVASDRLRNTKDSVTGIALSSGYDSESAFRKAFRTVMGSSPRRYSRAAHESGFIERPRDPFRAHSA
ncbi:AraC family transcriptional regulator [Granulicella arctica]|uniref:AraC family transcriptional regulator n=1 Tax=Granulicella arctica TaxID=940613 RepID=UPI0021DFC534|nr:AraC family transcriptional regulator [Granulicella arctica]